MIFKKNKRINPPEVFGIIKLNEVAKEMGVYDDFNKIIEVNEYGRIKRYPYSEDQVEILQKKGIPIVDEELTDDYNFVDTPEEGGLVSYRR